jgi:methyl-accepting chemotaxis protein
MIRDVTIQSGHAAKKSEQMSESLTAQAQSLTREVSRFSV